MAKANPKIAKLNDILKLLAIADLSMPVSSSRFRMRVRLNPVTQCASFMVFGSILS
jgi:hypothetical protein